MVQFYQFNTLDHYPTMYTKKYPFDHFLSIVHSEKSSNKMLTAKAGYKIKWDHIHILFCVVLCVFGMKGEG